jgi:energy-coupling factor transporter ATP-binding protein EcfA2
MGHEKALTNVHDVTRKFRMSHNSEERLPSSGLPSAESTSDDGFVHVRGAREHNLKNVDVEVPRNALVVFTGVSGSGKSSLAFSTLYAEAQRRYLESVSPYARRLFHQLGVPDVDLIEGLPPAVALQQQRGSPTARSSVGSVTTLSNLLRMLYSRTGKYPPGQPHLEAESFSPNTPEGACPKCHGLGRIHEVTEASMVPDSSLTIRERAVASWPQAWGGQNLRDILVTLGIEVDTPWRDLLCQLVSTSNFSFLRGGSHPGELVHQAAALGLAGIGLADRNSFAGVVRGHIAAREVSASNPAFRYLVGVRLVFSDKTPDIIAYPTDRAAYGRLCLLLTTGNRRAVKGECILRFEDLLAQSEGSLFIVFGDNAPFGADEFVARKLMVTAPGRVWLGISCRLHGNDRARLNQMASVARRIGVPMIATNDVLYHHYTRRPLQDVLTCIRLHLTIDEGGRRLEANAERYIKPEAHMRSATMFGEHLDAIAQTDRFLSLIHFSLGELRYNYPEETIGNGHIAASRCYKEVEQIGHLVCPPRSG